MIAELENRIRDMVCNELNLEYANGFDIFTGEAMITKGIMGFTLRIVLGYTHLGQGCGISEELTLNMVYEEQIEEGIEQIVNTLKRGAEEKIERTKLERGRM